MPGSSYCGNGLAPFLQSPIGECGVWPVKRAAEIEGGDLVVGGLHMVHEREEGLTCGPVMPQGGLQGPNSIRK